MNNWIFLLAALAVAPSLHAQSVPAPAAQGSAMSEGVVRKIDVANGKLTLRHGPLANLDMPPMTMVFRVRSPGLLNGIKVGDPVNFHAESIDGVLTVTVLQAAP